GPLAACGGSRTSAANGPRVVVVGAGLAGLACAHRLRRGGIDASVYEARPDRVGGRCWTAREFGDGQVGEHGGEFIDSDHARMHALVRELGLRLEDRAAWTRRRSPAHADLYLDGSMRGYDVVYRDFGALKRHLRADARRTDYSGAFAGPAARTFDDRTAAEWLDSRVPGGGDSLLGRAMREYLSDEFGLDADRLSATNIFYLLEGDRDDIDGSDERYHVHGGNDQVPRGLAAGLESGALHLDSPLEALRRRPDGSYRLGFGGPGPDVAADHVVLALPFTALRRVDLARASISRLKRECIEKLGMGTNSKVLMQFRHRPYREGRWSGELTTDRPFLDTWDSTLTQPGRMSVLTVYSGGSVGAGYPAARAHGPAPDRVVRGTLAALERAVPGISRDFAGRAWLDEWAADPWVHGSYAAFLPGQATRYSGVIARREGNLHFAGEHTLVAYQGFLEGAVESGERCAREILRAAPRRARVQGSVFS
ncbi:MAG: flavin monoamine oxidase family protein, partial [Solirubrobacterales bacterium]